MYVFRNSGVLPDEVGILGHVLEVNKTNSIQPIKFDIYWLTFF